MSASRALRLLLREAEGHRPNEPVTWMDLTRALRSALTAAEEYEYEDRMGEDL